MNYDCPKCRSSQTASFEMLHQKGTSSGTINASTITVGGDFGLTSGHFNSQSALAQKLSPPVSPKAGCGIQILIGIGAGILGIFIGGGILEGIDAVVKLSQNTSLMVLPFILIVGFLLYGLYLYNRHIQRNKIPVYHEQLEEWTNSMICTRCGFTWVRQ